MIKVKLYSDGKAHKGADLALKSRLYVSGWALSGELLSIREAKRKDDRVAVLIKDKAPVAVAILSGRSVQAFVRKQERRNGYGRMVVKELSPPDNAWTGTGIDGSDSFWNKVLERKL
jgi:hypothetical protein